MRMPGGCSGHLAGTTRERTVDQADTRPERMNSPLEIREVRLRGLPRRKAAAVHQGGRSSR
jgi:hypothetical protein